MEDFWFRGSRVLARALGVMMLMGILAVTGIPEVASAYAPHAPIRIAGDADLTAANGVTGGSGTPEDPYVIEGWEIADPAKHGIDIEGTRAYLVVRGNFAHSAKNWTGVRLMDARNVTVEGNVLSNEGAGISVALSAGVVLRNNTLTQDQYGIYLTGTADSLLEANRVSAAYYGIGITNTSDVQLVGNVVSDVIAGIWVGYSTNLTMRANTLTGAGVFLDGADGPRSLPFYRTHVITPDNLVNGKPLLYYRDRDDVTVDSVPVGQLIVVNSTRIRARGLQIADTDVAVEFAHVRDASVVASNLSWSGFGVWGVTSRDVTFASNDLVRDGYGFFLRDFVNTTVEGNRVILNGEGLYFDLADTFTVRWNIVSSNNRLGLSLAVGSRNVTVAGNDVSRNGAGVYCVGESWNYTIVGNALSRNARFGLACNGIFGLYLGGNRVEGNGDYGLALSGVRNVVAVENTVSGNPRGVYLMTGSDRAQVFHNRLVGNGVQAYDDASYRNGWDDAYPSGGNWWSDYTGPDNCSGMLQDVCPDPDGIGDVWRVIDADSQDRYPLVAYPDFGPHALPAVRPGPTGDLGTTFVFDGLLSWDADGPITAYRWDFGDGVVVDGPVVPHRYALRGTYNVTLYVWDTSGKMGTTAIVVGVRNRAPIADAGPDFVAAKRTTVRLNGSGSRDPDADSLRFSWSQVLGPSVLLDNAANPAPSFLPAASGVYGFRLDVDDGRGGVGTDWTNVTVANRPPAVDAGAGRVGCLRGEPLALTGTASDPDGDSLTYAWTLAAGPAVAISGAGSLSAAVTPALPGLYRFALTVDDGDGGVATDTVAVEVVNRAPSVTAGADPDARVGIALRLTANATDPDGDALTYAWTQTAGPPVSLADADTATPSFTPGGPGTYTFSVTVTDGFGGIATDAVTIPVAPAPAASVWVIPWPWVGATALTVILFLLVVVAWRRRKRKDGR